MTNMEEAKLPYKAKICYASIAMVTDFDYWHRDQKNVEVTDIVKTVSTNPTAGKDRVKKVTEMVEAGCMRC